MLSKPALWVGAFVGFYRPTAEDVRRLDPVSKFLYAARSVILVISAQAAIIAALLAATDRRFHFSHFVLVLIGFVVAHMISNLSNDYFGFRRGDDTPDSPRMRYTVHPIASGVLESRTLAMGIAVLSVLGLSIAAYFILEYGWLAGSFFLLGVALLFGYDAAPTPLKNVGLGEIAVFLVWGPLMIGGGYAVIAGVLSTDALYASIPYGLGVMSILIGKHIDQREFDAGRRIGTLPVMLGDRRARRFDIAAIALMYIVIGALVLTGLLTPFVLLVAVAMPRAVRAISILREPRPAEPPQGYVGWPLWYHRTCLVHNRLFGWLYIAGLAAGALWPELRIRA